MDWEDCPAESWLDVPQALERLRELTGLSLNGRQLSSLCRAELCRVYVDCSFAHGVVGAEQMFVRRIRATGRCQWLEGGEWREAADPALLTLAGSVVVRGCAWVYVAERRRPGREEGIWRMSLAGQQRQLYFRPADLQALAERIREGAQRLQALRASA